MNTVAHQMTEQFIINHLGKFNRINFSFFIFSGTKDKEETTLCCQVEYNFTFEKSFLSALADGVFIKRSRFI